MKLPLKHHPYPGECPYCLKPVGYIGRFFAWFFGTRFHNCDFSNVADPVVLRESGGGET